MSPGLSALERSLVCTWNISVTHQQSSLFSKHTHNTESWNTPSSIHYEL